MRRYIKAIYEQYMQTKLANKIILVIGIICFCQLAASVGIYAYAYGQRKKEVIENNMQILQQANSNYLSAIVEELENATRELFYDGGFWDSGQYESPGIEDNRIYSILAGKYHSVRNIDSIYLFSSQNDKFYIMDELSFSGIPVKTLNNNSFLTDYEDLAGEEWFAEAVKKDGGMAVSRNKEIRSGVRDIVSFSRYLKYPLKTRDSYYLVTINIREERFDVLRRQLCKEDEYLLILDNEGKFIYGNGEDAIHIQLESSMDILDGMSGIHPWCNFKINGKDYIVIRNVADNGKWTMIKAVKKETVMGGVTMQFIGNCFFMLVLVLLEAVILYYVICRTTKPIEYLAGIMSHYTQGKAYGEYGEKLSGRKDEVGVLYSSFEKMNDRIDELIKLEYISQINEKQARLEALQAQIDPHFLYNTLQTISGIAIEKDVLEIEQINNSLSSILRYSLNKQKSVVQLSEELQNVKNYMEIQKYRYGDRIDLKIELSEKILRCHVPVFTLQLAVENSIKHGLEKKIGVEIIEIFDRVEGRKGILCVRDNGAGIEEGRLKEIQKMLLGKVGDITKGYDLKGLVNLNERVKSQFGEGYGIMIGNNQGEGALLKIYIPLDEEEEIYGPAGEDKSGDCR